MRHAGSRYRRQLSDGVPQARRNVTCRVRLVLLDLDGTLADTAPDLAAAANRMRISRGMEPLPIAELRPYVSHGARGMVGRAFNVAPDDARYAELRQEFLREYESALCVDFLFVPGHGRHAATVWSSAGSGGESSPTNSRVLQCRWCSAEAFRSVRRASSAVTPRRFRNPILPRCCTHCRARPLMRPLPFTSGMINAISMLDAQPACVPWLRVTGISVTGYRINNGVRMRVIHSPPELITLLAE